jgi:hypothetical protein
MLKDRKISRQDAETPRKDRMNTMNTMREGTEGGQECPRSERISVEVALRIVDTVGGDRRTEGLIMQYLRERHSAPTVLDIPPKVAQAILDRPKAFVRAALEWCLPDVPF